MKRIHLTITSLLVTVCCCSLNAQQTATDLSVQFQEMATQFRGKYKVPGLGMAIGHKGKIVYAAGSGLSDLENGVKASNETVFRTASIAKPITAVALLQLVDQGKISLDDPIQNHCPEFPQTDQELTVRHLLCHQGGIRHYKYPGESSGKKHYLTIKQSLDLFKDEPLLFEPGTKYRYTTYGYSLLGRAIETASGMSYRDYLQKNVFDPAGMDSAGIDDWFRIIPHRTRGYTKVSTGMWMQMPPELRKSIKVGQVLNCQLHDTSMKVPGGGLICSPTDLVKFGQAMLADKLIKPSTRTSAWTEQKTSDGKPTGYGLGWGIGSNDGMAVIRHSGGQAGTSTMLVIIPELDLVVAVMCNLQGTPALELARSLGETFIQSVEPVPAGN